MKSIGNYGTGGSNIILRNRQLNFVNLVATITDTRVHEDTLILVYYSEATQVAAQAAGITTETNEGNITFTAANPPSSTIVCDVVLLSANMVSQMASASDIDYSNAQSGLTSTDVQGAVDELAQSYPASKVIMTGGGNVEDALDVVSGTFTAAENVTVLHSKVRKQRNIVSLDIFCQKNLTANQWNHVGDIPANFAPDIYNTYFPGLNDTDVGIFESRVQGTSIDIYPTVSGTKNFALVTTYITTN